MTQDFCADARALGVRLHAAGKPEWSRRIDQVLAAGATSSEILMGVRSTLREMVDDEPNLPRLLRREAFDLVERIGRAL